MAEMIQRMIEAGATPPVISIAVEAYEAVSGTSPGQVRDIVRKYERARRAKSRKKHPINKANAEANDAASKPSIVRDTTKERCDLSSLPSLLTEEVATKQGSKKEVVTRARGMRLTADAKLSEVDKQFAFDHGAQDPDALWTEFIDYWIGVPGPRGTKLDWSATWRNRVRAVIPTRGKPHGNRTGRTELQSALDKAREYARGGDQPGGGIPEVGPTRRG